VFFWELRSSIPFLLSVNPSILIQWLQALTSSCSCSRLCTSICIWSALLIWMVLRFTIILLFLISFFRNIFSNFFLLILTCLAGFRCSCCQQEVHCLQVSYLPVEYNLWLKRRILFYTVLIIFRQKYTLRSLFLPFFVVPVLTWDWRFLLSLYFWKQ